MWTNRLFSMKNEVVFFILWVAFLFFISCKPQKQSSKIDFIGKEFHGFWAETSWKYKFAKDGSFTFKCEGHYDFNTYKGIYTVLDSIILLIPDSDWQVFDGVLETKLRIMSNECIRDFNDNFYCTSTDSINFYNDKKYEFQEKMMALLDSLPETKSAKKEALSRDSTVKFRYGYNRIIVVNKIEYHAFDLDKMYEDDGRSYTQETFLIKKQPFEIYLHDLKGNALSLIYKE